MACRFSGSGEIAVQFKGPSSVLPEGQICEIVGRCKCGDSSPLDRHIADVGTATLRICLESTAALPAP